MHKFTGFKGRAAGIIIAAAVFATTLITFNPVDAAAINDLKKGSPYAREAIEELAKQDIIKGNSEGNFNPHDTITRAEMTKLIVSVLDADISNPSDTLPFKDVPKGHWAYPYVYAAYKNNIVAGVSKDRFDLNAPCTREQMAVILVRAVGLDEKVLKVRQKHKNLPEYKDADKISQWAREYVEFAIENGLIKGTSAGRFTPRDGAKREQAAVLVYRFLNNKQSIKTAADAMVNFNRDNFPELYEALKNNESIDFKGEYSADIKIETKVKGSVESVRIDITGTGAANGQNTSSKFEIITSVPGMEETVSGYEMIKVDGIYYVKSHGGNEWTIMDEDEIIEQGFVNVNERMISGRGTSIYENFSSLLIEKEGEATVNGEKTVKYSITKGLEEGLLSGQAAGFITGMKINSLEYSVYVNEEGSIVKEELNINIDSVDNDFEVNTDIEANLTFKNIGAEIEIKPPVENKADIGNF